MDTGWPWPLDAVQEWFEDLMQSIWDAVAWAASQVWRLLPYWVRSGLELLRDLAWNVGAEVLAFFRDPVKAIGTGLAWVRDQILDRLSPIKSAIDAVGKLVWDALPTPIKGALEWLGRLTSSIIDAFVAFLKDPVKALRGLVDSIVDKVQPIIDPIADRLGHVAGYFTSRFVDFMEDPMGSINACLVWASGEIKTMFDGAFGSAADVIGRALSGIADTFKAPLLAVVEGFLRMLGAEFTSASPQYAIYRDPRVSTTNIVAGWIYEGIRGGCEWLMKSLMWVGEMVVGAVNAVVGAVQSGLTALFTDVTNSITGALVAGSPDPKIKVAADVMVKAVWSRQVNIISDMYKSPPVAEDVFNAAALTVAGLTAAGLGGMVIGAAIDIAHPLKEIMAHRTIRELMWMVGVPAVTASIITLPAAIGLLTPLRYALNEKWQPMQPPATDIIRFAVRECFEPERLPTLLAYYPGEEYTRALAREGYTETWAKFYWGAHWVLPSIDALNAYLYRHDDFTPMWEKYMRYHDYIPEGISWLREIIYPPWTRVDIRRMWDMRTISESDMYREYRWGGYDDAHAKGLVLWTKVYVALPDLKARYKNGWITAEDMRLELIKLGMPESRANELMQTILPAAKEERTSKERDLTKTDILTLYKYGQISELQAAEMLISLGYDETEAGYLVAVQSERLEVELRELTTAQILKAYRYEIFNRDEAKTKLIGAGWAEKAAEILLKLEDIRLTDSQVERERERDLTPAQILRATKAGIINLDTGIKYLEYLGYTKWELNVLLKLEGLA